MFLDWLLLSGKGAYLSLLPHKVIIESPLFTTTYIDDHTGCSHHLGLKHY